MYNFLEILNHISKNLNDFRRTRSEDVQPPRPLDLTSVDFGDLMGRIRHHVLTNRIRVRTYFFLTVISSVSRDVILKPTWCFTNTILERFLTRNISTIVLGRRIFPRF